MTSRMNKNAEASEYQNLPDYYADYIAEDLRVPVQNNSYESWADQVSNNFQAEV